MRRLALAWLAFGLFAAGTAIAEAPPVPPPMPSISPPPEQPGAPKPVNTAADEASIYIMPDTGYTSLCFSRVEMNAILAASEQYRVNLAKAREEASHHQQSDDFLSTLQQGAGASRAMQHPQFYFSSLVYHTPEDWALWMNNVKFTGQIRQSGEVTVERVDGQRAWFTWRPKLFSLYAERYATAHDSRVSLDNDAKAFTFALYPNQTFSSYTLTVEEGWLPPTRKEDVTFTPAQQRAAAAENLSPVTVGAPGAAK